MAEHDTPRTHAPKSLRDAAWLKRPETCAVFTALSGDGVETRAVGGAVRDALLGLDVTDVDFATTAAPDTVMGLARGAGLKAIPTGIAHGTVTVVADGMSFEVTTLRRDVETYGRHAKVAFTQDWTEDAKRRDFTLNALYADADGTLYDPLGCYEDFAARRVRFIGDARARIKEDYLRILRFFRFNAIYGSGPLDQEGLAACVRARAGLAQLSAERVWAELKRILAAPQAMSGIDALFRYGLLADILGSAPRPGRLVRLIDIETAQGREPSAPLRLAALCLFVAEDAPRLAARFKLSNAEQAVLALGASETCDMALPDEDAAKRLLYRLGPDAYASQTLLAWAASGVAADDTEWDRALALPERWQAPSFPLRGADIMALGVEGPVIGEILRALEAGWLESGFSEEQEVLLAKAKTLVAKAKTLAG
ncbi:MAG TPA: CCA tRNA nucleotidyltransferase [Methyloceanibacter sp.]|nr:CCA tRNA nucleotidyltransferase [Methyloceanibacter sp.]